MEEEITLLVGLYGMEWSWKALTSSGKDGFKEILDEEVVESFEKLEIPEDEQYFQQDIVPKHTSQLAKK